MSSFREQSYASLDYAFSQEDDESLARRLQKEEVQQMRQSAILQQEKDDMELARQLANMSDSVNDFDAYLNSNEEENSKPSATSRSHSGAEALSRIDERAGAGEEKSREESDLDLALRLVEEEAENSQSRDLSGNPLTAGGTDNSNSGVSRFLDDSRFANFLAETGISIDEVSQESLADIFNAMHPSTSNIDIPGGLQGLSVNDRSSINTNETPNPYANMYLEENSARPAGAFCVTPEGVATAAGGGTPSDGPSSTPRIAGNPPASPVTRPQSQRRRATSVDHHPAADQPRRPRRPSEPDMPVALPVASPPTIPVASPMGQTTEASRAARRASTNEGMAEGRNIETSSTPATSGQVTAANNNQAAASAGVAPVTSQQPRDPQRSVGRTRSGDVLRSGHMRNDIERRAPARSRSADLSPYAAANRRNRRLRSSISHVSSDSDDRAQTNVDILDPKVLSPEFPSPTASRTKQKKKGILGFFARNREPKDHETKHHKGASKSPKRAGRRRSRIEDIPVADVTPANVADSVARPTTSNIPDPAPRHAEPLEAPVRRTSNRSIGGPQTRQVSLRREVSWSSGHSGGASAAPTQTVNKSGLVCGACGKRGGKFVVGQMEKAYHVECFKCMSCHDLIDPTSIFALIVDANGERQPVHHKCYTDMFGIKCTVCSDMITADEDGSVLFVRHPFFDQEQMCPKHEANPGRRCTSCHRFEPEGQPFASLNDGDRCVCYACCRTVIMDNGDVKPIWDQVIEFFEKTLKLPIWEGMREIPVLVVGEDALSDRTQNTAHGESTQMTTRGICLTEHEYRGSFRSPSLRFNEQSLEFEAKDGDAKGFDIVDLEVVRRRSHVSTVTAILCLSGLPRDLTASVLAHEATHAWIKLHPNYSVRRPIPPMVEEGVAQLVASLFLQDGLEPPDTYDDGQGPTDAKLRQYFKFSIETDDDEIYGDGFRLSAQAYSAVGIEYLLNHIVDQQNFPET